MSAQLPITIGPYRVLAEMGRGGMGVVYRAQHIQTGEVFAVKTVRVPFSRQITGLRREIKALQGISHPGVVSIADEGIQGGVPWYAMEIIEGVTLRELNAACWRAVGKGRQPIDPDTKVRRTGPTVPTFFPEDTVDATTAFTSTTGSARNTSAATGRKAEALLHFKEAAPDAPVAAGELGKMLALVHRLCKALAFLHGEGVVHCDLKLDNVIVTPEHNPVLVDFGLVSLFEGSGREVLDVHGRMLGTVFYMAPEQISGDSVDARADLYALGCILYTLLTRRPPFLGTSSREVLDAHLGTPPTPPSKLVKDVPAGLDELVMSLLSKRPRDRPGHAYDVAAALESLGVQPDSEGVPLPEPRAYLYRPELEGRTEAFGELLGAIGALEEGRGGMLALSGESGVGKTRLAMEATREALVRRIRVITGECQGYDATLASAEPSGAAMQPMRGLLQAMVDVCREHGVSETARIFGERGPLLARFEPSIGRLSGLEGAPVAHLGHFDVLRAMEAAVKAFVEHNPAVFVIDDLQWADPLTLSVLDHLIPQLGAHPILILVTWRPEDANPELSALMASPSINTISLGRLDEESVEAMVCGMLSMSDPPEALVQFLCKHSEGNPFFVNEYLHAAVEEGVLHRDLTGRWYLAVEDALSDELPLPNALHGLLESRLRELGPVSAGLVEVASVLGREVEVGLLAKLCGLTPGQLQTCIRQILLRQIMMEATPNTLRFTHHKVRDVAYARLDPEYRASLHEAAAEALDALALRGGEGRERRLVSQATHREKIGDTQRAAQCCLQAARLAADRGGLEDARRLFRAHLRLSPQPSVETLDVRIELALKVLAPLGECDTAVSEARQAMRAARRLGDKALTARCLMALGEIYMEMGRSDEALAVSEQALALVAQSSGAGEP